MNHKENHKETNVRRAFGRAFRFLKVRGTGRQDLLFFAFWNIIILL